MRCICHHSLRTIGGSAEPFTAMTSVNLKCYRAAGELSVACKYPQVRTTTAMIDGEPSSVQLQLDVSYEPDRMEKALLPGIRQACVKGGSYAPQLLFLREDGRGSVEDHTRDSKRNSGCLFSRHVPTVPIALSSRQPVSTQLPPQEWPQALLFRSAETGFSYLHQNGLKLICLYAENSIVAGPIEISQQYTLSFC